MPPSVFVFVVSVTVVVALGVVLSATAAAWRLPGLLEVGRGRARSAVDSGVPYVGRAVTAAVLALAGFAITLVIGYFLGQLAHALETSVDVPLFEWFRSRQLHGSWSDAWNIVTKMGNRAQTQRITIIGAVLLAVLWRRRGWWIPFVALPIGYLFEKFGQQLLAAVVHRGHPPTTLGTYPSGGCARVMVVYGLLIFLVLRWKRVSCRGWVAGWSFLALLVTVEVYSRTYLLKHWFTDGVGGVLFGGLVLCLMIGAASVLDRAAQPSSPAVGDTTPQPESAVAGGGTRRDRCRWPAARHVSSNHPRWRPRHVNIASIAALAGVSQQVAAHRRRGTSDDRAPGHRGTVRRGLVKLLVDEVSRVSGGTGAERSAVRAGHLLRDGVAPWATPTLSAEATP